MFKEQSPENIYSLSRVLSRKPLMVIIHKGIKKGFLSLWYKENPQIHGCLMQLSEEGFPLTILPWDGDGDLLNQINEKKRLCVLIFQRGEIETEIDLKKLILLSNIQGWLIIQKDQIINKNPNIKKDIIRTHIKLLVNNELKDYKKDQTPHLLRYFSKNSYESFRLY